MRSFADDFVISGASWAAFERLVLRLIRARGFTRSGVVGQSGDEGADVLGVRNDRRWLFQAKAYNKPVSVDVMNEAINAARIYEVDVPVVVSKSGFTGEAYQLQSKVNNDGVKLQLWDRGVLNKQCSLLGGGVPIDNTENLEFRPYQKDAVEGIVGAFHSNKNGSALVVLATGLGKTFVAGEAMRRLAKFRSHVLILAHTKDLVYQLERAFWPFLTTGERTTVVMDGDKVSNESDLLEYDFIFATRDSMHSLVKSGCVLPDFDFVIVDECHHLGSETYERVLDELNVGKPSGPFLLGLTATPWRPDGQDLSHRFGAPVVSIDLGKGLREGYLSNVDYRMFTDNIKWDSISDHNSNLLSPKQINRTLFIQEWDDAVIDSIQAAWLELGSKARGIVFCGTIDHAIQIANKINALGFTSAKALYSGSASAGVPALKVSERNKAIWDFAEGKVGILCSVDVLNEGVDVPDVNLIVFQRVTHSRRIFTQQLGRGLRIAEGKTKVIVLDFVTDIRRFAAGLQLDTELSKPGERVKKVRLNSKVTFIRSNKIDQSGKQFLTEWLGDLEAVEAAGDDVSILKFPRNGK